MISLALAQSHVARPFNGLFFTTAAAVIPVFFIALALQGTYYRALLERARITANDAREAFLLAASLPKPGIHRDLVMSHARHGCLSGTVRFVGAVVLLCLAILFVAAGSVGEVTALNALSAQYASRENQDGVLASVTYLAVAVAVPPGLLLVRYLLATLWRQGALAVTSLRPVFPRFDALLRHLAVNRPTWPPEEDSSGHENDYPVDKED